MDSAADIIRRHLCDDVYELAAKPHWFEPYDKKELLLQIQARQKAKSKLPSWYGNFDLIFPPPLSVEQGSSELTAQYKAQLVRGHLLADLTGGMGIDSSAFSAHFQKVIFIEKQENLAKNARFNFTALGCDNIEVRCADSTEIWSELTNADCFFLDPARRKEGHKVFLLEDCEPNIIQLIPNILQKIKDHPDLRILIKLSPMFDLHQLFCQLPHISEIHVVAVDNEVKELLADIRPETVQNPEIHCVNLGKSIHTEHFTQNCEAILAEMAESVGKYLYEPHSTVMKAGKMDELAARFGLKKLQRNSHLYTSQQLFTDFFGRVFEVESVFGMGKGELKNGLAGIGRANITVRNFPMKEAELRKKLKLADGGDTTLIATTLGSNKHILIRAKKVDCPTDLRLRT